LECCTPGFYLRITESRGLTLLSGFEGIDGGKAATPEYGIDPLDCEIVNLDALIECDHGLRAITHQWASYGLQRHSSWHRSSALQSITVTSA
jgi:hypothetical protein